MKLRFKDVDNTPSSWRGGKEAKAALEELAVDPKFGEKDVRILKQSKLYHT
jgi:hypothetical protein